MECNWTIIQAVDLSCYKNEERSIRNYCLHLFYLMNIFLGFGCIKTNKPNLTKNIARNFGIGSPSLKESFKYFVSVTNVGYKCYSGDHLACITPQQ